MKYLHSTRQYQAVQADDKSYNVYALTDGWQTPMYQLPIDMVEDTKDWVPEPKSIPKSFMEGLNITP